MGNAVEGKVQDNRLNCLRLTSEIGDLELMLKSLEREIESIYRQVQQLKSDQGFAKTQLVLSLLASMAGQLTLAIKVTRFC